MDNRPIQLSLLVEVPVPTAPIVETEATETSASPCSVNGSEWYDPLDVVCSKKRTCERLILEANRILKIAEAAHLLAYDTLDNVMWQQYDRWMRKYALVIDSLCRATPEDIKEFRAAVLAEVKKLEKWMDMVLSMDESKLSSGTREELSATAARYLRLCDQLKIVEEKIGEERG